MDIQVTQILFQIVNFSVVLGALSYLLYKPILKIFEERSKRIEEGQKAAEEALRSKEALDQMKEEAQTALKKERTQVLKKAQDEAAEKRQEILTQAKQEAQEEIAKMKKDWEREKQLLVLNSKEELVHAVVSVAEKLIQKKFDKKADEQLIESELTNILKSV